MKLTIALLALVVAAECVEPLPAETFLGFEEYCQHFEYPVEKHLITTEDGYVLTYFRIQAKHSRMQPGLPVLYLQHGVIDSSDTFIVSREGTACSIPSRRECAWLLLREPWLRCLAGQLQRQQALARAPDALSLLEAVLGVLVAGNGG